VHLRHAQLSWNDVFKKGNAQTTKNCEFEKNVAQETPVPLGLRMTLRDYILVTR